MRTLMWIAIGFAAACLINAYGAIGSWGFVAATAIFLLIFGAVRKNSKFRKCILVLMMGMLLGFLWFRGYDYLKLKPLWAISGTKMTTTATLSDYGYQTTKGYAADGILTLNGKEYRTRFYLDSGKNLEPGNTITGTFYLRYTGPGGEKEATYHQGKGIFLLAYGDGHISAESSQKIPVHFYPAVIRKNMTGLIDSVFPADTAGFARALLLGDDSQLSQKVDNDLKDSGIRHVVAVSGLHVSILFGLIYMLSGRKRAIIAALGIPVLLLFAAIAGFTPSIVRACIMQILMILAMLFNRDYDSPTALSMAVLVLLIINPLAVTSVSFQLSVGCMIGILLVSEPIRKYLMGKGRMGRFSGKSPMGRFCSFVAASVSVTLGAMLFTVPLCSFYFGTISLIGILTNMLTLWAVTFAFYGIIFSCAMGIIWQPAGVFLAGIASLFIRYCLFVSHILARIPMAFVYTENIYITAWIILCYVLIGIFASGRRKHPWILTGCIAVSFAVSVLCVRLEPETADFFVSVLDVGQGQCVLLQNEDHAYLVDCGSEKKGKAADVALQNMWSYGIDHLDGLILTHYDSDHVNGTERLLNRIPAEELYLPDTYDDNGLREEITRENEGNITWVTEIITLEIPDGILTIIPSQQGKSDNDSGLCVLFQPRGYDILITGDRGFAGEQELMEVIDLPKLELLVVGHHGSRYSTGLDFLMDTRPSAAAISAGKNNRYGHPAQDTLERLAIFDCTVFRTDLDGTITFRGEKNG